jgi:hypothetical protein
LYSFRLKGRVVSSDMEAFELEGSEIEAMVIQLEV